MTVLFTDTERILVEWMNTSDDPPSGEMSPDWILRYYPYDDATAGEIFAELRNLVASDQTTQAGCGELRFEAAFELITEAANAFVRRFEFYVTDRLYRLPPSRLRRLKEEYGHITRIPGLSARIRELKRFAPKLGGEAPWRRPLRELRDGQKLFNQAIADGQVRIALRWGASQASILDKAGPRWLHFLRDNSRQLRKAIDTALTDDWLKGEVGSPDRNLLIALVARIIQVHETLTGRPLTHSIQVEGRHSCNVGSNRPSSGIRLIHACLDSIDPGQSDDASAHLIREAYQTNSR